MFTPSAAFCQYVVGALRRSRVASGQDLWINFWPTPPQVNPVVAVIPPPYFFFSTGYSSTCPFCFVYIDDVITSGHCTPDKFILFTPALLPLFFVLEKIMIDIFLERKKNSNNAKTTEVMIHNLLLSLSSVSKHQSYMKNDLPPLIQVTSILLRYNSNQK